MPVPLRSSTPLVADAPLTMVPLLPTLVVGSYKGGVWKTSLAVAIAERLAWADLKVLLVTSDTQEDARSRLGLKASDPQIARIERGKGTLTVLGARDSVAIDLLYRSGPGRLGQGSFDVAVVDTPPILEGGHLPGVLLVTPIDGTDAARNLISMLRGVPSNSEIILAKVHRMDPVQWEQDATAIEQAAGRAIQYLSSPLPRSAPVEAAHNNGRSVWALPRRGCTWEFLSAVDTLACSLWTKAFPKKPWPAMPPLKATAYVDGWDGKDAP